MIALDSSALLAIIGKETEAGILLAALQHDRDLVISAATLAEVLIVTDRRNIGDLMRRLIARLSPVVVPSDEYTALRVAEIYQQWGKGRHAARLNLIDCFSYDAARENDCPLLYVGNDFARTDIRSALMA